MTRTRSSVSLTGGEPAPRPAPGAALAGAWWDAPPLPPAGMAILTAPGLYGSGPAHWQTLWERRFPAWERVVQRDWSCPSLHSWAGRLAEAVARRRAPAPAGVVVVAHSFGCLALLRQAAEEPDGIAGALLVAPADPDRFGVAPLLPAARLPFPTTLVASRNDPWIAQRTAFAWGALWGSELHDAGAIGHINADSGLGEWPQGLALLSGLLQRIEAADIPQGRSGATPAWQPDPDVRPGVPYIQGE